MNRMLPLLALLAAQAISLGCSGFQEREVRVRFEIVSPALCDGASASLERLALFLSSPTLVTADGTSSRWTLKPSAATTADVVLLDFDACESLELVGTWPERQAPDRLVATLGLPAELNHANPALAQGPLTDPSMHWSWRAGYKFLRFEATQDDADLLFHLGSTGCRSLEPVDCLHPNSTSVSLALRSSADGWTARLVPDELFAALQVQGGDGRCQSTPSDLDCAELLPPTGPALRSLFEPEETGA